METKTAQEVLIPFCGNMQEFAKRYKEETNFQRCHSILTFSTPVRMLYGRKIRSAKTDTVHKVKSIFFVDDDTKAYYVAGRMKNSGFRLYTDNLVSVKIVFTEKDYSKEWANIAKSMRKHNINLDVAKAIEDHLEGKEEYIHGFQNYWKKTDRPRRMSFKDITRGESIEDLKKRVTPSTYSENVMSFYRRIYGQKRDRSVSLAYNKNNPETTVHFDSASEFAGCGNGDYYCMYSPTMAFYGESD